MEHKEYVSFDERVDAQYAILKKNPFGWLAVGLLMVIFVLIFSNYRKAHELRSVCETVLSLDEQGAYENYASIRDVHHHLPGALEHLEEVQKLLDSCENATAEAEPWDSSDE